MLRKYMLDENGEPVPVGDTAEEFHRWAWWDFECWRDRVLASAVIDVGVQVSTTFTSYDLRCDKRNNLEQHLASGADAVLWETRVSGGPFDGRRRHYTSRADAMAGHGWWVSIVASAHWDPDPTPTGWS